MGHDGDATSKRGGNRRSSSDMYRHEGSGFRTPGEAGDNDHQEVSLLLAGRNPLQNSVLDYSQVLCILSSVFKKQVCT